VARRRRRETDPQSKGADESMAKKTAARGAKKSAAKGSSKSSGSRKASSSRSTKTAGKKKTGGGRRPNAAFMAPVTPSAQLSEVVGSKPLPRTELTKKLWAYIKKNGLQDQKNRRMINADDSLRPIFGKAQVSMFDMTKLVNKHVKA